MFICAGKSEQFDFALPVGIGLVDVATRLTQRCIAQKPDFLCFVGTAGSYGEKAIFDIIESRYATQIEQSLIHADAYTPLEEIVKGISSLGDESETDAVLFKNRNVSRETVVNSSNYITTNEAAGVWHRERGIHLENMEFYAVVKVAQMFDIPAMGIFAVTNYCNEDAHRDFIKNHQEAMERLTEYTKRYL